MAVTTHLVSFLLPPIAARQIPETLPTSNTLHLWPDAKSATGQPIARI